MTLIFRVLCFPVYLIQKLLATIFYIILGVEKSVGWHRSSIERVCDNLNIDISKHVVDTADGHTLTLHRLRFKNHDGIKTYTSSKGKSVLLQHGLLESSIVWVAYGKVSLAFMLLEQGFDVWLGNNRGNAYSSGSWGLWGNNASNWDFQHIAKEDFTSNVKYILKSTNSDKILYIGQSQGAAQAVVGINHLPEMSERLSALVLLSPALFLKKPDNAVVQFLMENVPGLGYRIIFPLIALAQCLTPNFILLPFSHWAMGAMGWYRSPIGWDASKILFKGTPSSGTSAANMMHWVNLSNNEGDIEFDARKVKCPTYCYVGSHDDVIDAKKTANSISKLPNLKYFHCEPGYGHVDFVWSNKSTGVLYRQISNQLGEIVAS